MSSTLRPPLWARPFSSLPKGCERAESLRTYTAVVYGFSDSVLCTIWVCAGKAEGESPLVFSIVFRYSNN